MRAAIFDVDRTLLDGMSGFLFARYLWRTGAMPWAGRWRSAKAMLLYRSGLAGPEIIVEAGVTCCAGLTVPRVEQLADQAVSEVMRGRFYREGLAAIAGHRHRGDCVLLASGSNVFVAQAIARAAGANDAVGTDCRRENGLLLSHMIPPPCLGEGKREVVRRWLAARDLDPAAAVVYTDNGSDLPLLEIAGEAVAVNPDAELARAATARGWRVERWETPADERIRRSGTSWPLR